MVEARGHSITESRGGVARLKETQRTNLGLSDMEAEP